MVVTVGLLWVGLASGGCGFTANMMFVFVCDLVVGVEVVVVVAMAVGLWESVCGIFSKGLRERECVWESS